MEKEKKEKKEKKKKKNPLLIAIEKRLSRKDNVSPAATFIKNQKNKNKLLQDLMK